MFRILGRFAGDEIFWVYILHLKCLNLLYTDNDTWPDLMQGHIEDDLDSSWTLVVDPVLVMRQGWSIRKCKC